MIGYDSRPENTLIGKQKAVFLFLTALTGILIAYKPSLVLTLFFGLPALLLVAAKKTRFTGLLIILALSPFLGIIKAFTNVNLAPLSFDIALLILVALTVLDEIFSYNFNLLLPEILIAFFLLIGLIQIFNTNVPSIIIGMTGFRAAAFQSLALFAGVLLIKTKKQIRQIAMAIAGSALPVSLYGIKQFFYPGPVDYKIISSSLASPITYTALGKMRAFSTLSSPFHLGIFMVLAILLLAQPIWPRKATTRALLSTIFAVTLLLTITRANWLAVAAGIMFLIFTPLATKKTVFSLSPLFFVGIIFLVSFLLISLAPYYFTNPAYQYLTSLENVQSTSRYQGTIVNWTNVILPAIAKNPLGYGAGSAGDGINSKFIGPSFTSHNIFLKIGLEFGVVGLIIFTAIIIFVFIKGVHIYQNLNDPFLAKVSLWILSFFIAVVTAGLSTPITDAYPANLYLWLLLGVLLNLGKIEQNKPENTSHLLIRTQGDENGS